MNLLIDKSFVEKNLQVAIGYNNSNFDAYIREAQIFDLKPLLCESFFYEILKAENKDMLVLTGGDYPFNTINYNFTGLKLVLAYFTYARFIMKSPIISTTHGIVKKKTPESEPVEFQERKNLWYKYREEANTLFDEVRKYAERTKLAGWNCDEPCDNSFKYNSNVIQ